MSLFDPLPRKPFKRPMRERCVSVSGAKLWEADSFDIFDVVVSCEERFNIDIPNDAAAKFGARDAKGGR
jgi:hypothetical protein